MSPPFEVLARGPWPREHVRAVRDDAPVPRTPGAEAVLERAWQRARDDARATGRLLFPGPVAGLTRFEATPGSLVLHLRETDYRAFVGTNLSPEYRALPRTEAPRADALGLSILVSLPGEIVLLHHRGAACFEWPLAIDTPGGHIDPTLHLEGGAPSPVLGALDELESELGIRPGEVRALDVLGVCRIVETEKPQLVLEARVALGLDAVRARLSSARERFETHELLPVPRSTLAALARSGERVTPAGRASLWLASGAEPSDFPRRPGPC